MAWQKHSRRNSEIERGKRAVKKADFRMHRRVKKSGKIENFSYFYSGIPFAALSGNKAGKL